MVGRLLDWMGNEIERKYGGAPWVGYRKFLAEGNIAEAAKCFFYVAGGRWDAYHHKIGDTDAILAEYEARRAEKRARAGFSHRSAGSFVLLDSTTEVSRRCGTH